MRDSVQVHVGEFIGTFAFVFLSAATVCATFGSEPQPWQLLSVALATGASYAAFVACFLGHQTGYFNPSITLMLWVFRKLETSRLLSLIAVQFLGAGLAGLLLRIIFGGSEAVLRNTRLGTPHLELAYLIDAGMVGQLKGMLLELVLTFFLVFVLFGALLDPRRQAGGRLPRLAALWVGLAVSACTLAGGKLTGAGLNPVRYFGPMLFELTYQPDAWRDHTVYWMGPTAGAILAGLLYSACFLPADARGAAPSRASEG